MRIRLRGWIILLVWLSSGTFPVFAQNGLTVRLSAPDTSRFPTIQAFLDVHDAAGKVIHSLKPDQVTILEAENSIPIDNIEELRPGVQVVVAISPGPAFAIRNFQAVSRYDLMKDSLRSWAKGRLGTTTDDWSLLIEGGSTVSHASDPARFLEGLDSDAVDTHLAQPSIDTLAKAVTVASDPTPRAGMGRSILFITTSIEGDIDQALKDISDQARQQEISISVWFVASSGAMITQSAQKLTALATSSGGQVFTFSGEETIPNPDDFLDALRYIYQISYTSRVGLSGDHEFSAQVRIGEEQAQSNPKSFSVDLLPPQPAFVSPPIAIERVLPEGFENEAEIVLPDGNETSDLLTPKEIFLQVVFDFPDGRKRELVSSALLVDGKIVAENLTPPFDQFTWNLEGLKTDGTVQLQVQSTDMLGLTGTSIEMPVQISVEHPETDPWFVLRRNLVTISILLVLLAGGLLFLVLVLGGRLRPITQIAASRAPNTKPARASLPTAVETHAHSHTGWVSRLQRPHTSVVPDALAYFKRAAEDGASGDGTILPITAEDVLFGSDPAHANLLIDHACIEGVHARLKRSPEGDFWLYDQGSIAGTWINYNPVSQEGAPLQPGDLVHFGRIGFHFSTRETGRVLKPTIILETPLEGEVSQGDEDETEETAQ
jgi:hypothetical protein